MEKRLFSKLSLQERYLRLKKEGMFVATRELPAHWVYLFTLDGSYVEVHMNKALHQIQWIEIQENKNILNDYLKQIDIPLP